VNRGRLREGWRTARGENAFVEEEAAGSFGCQMSEQFKIRWGDLG
jgi:hypothetical protein